MTDVNSLTSKELKKRMLEKRDEERRIALVEREAYEGLRTSFVKGIESKVIPVVKEVFDLHAFICAETAAFRGVMADYGQLRTPGQLTYTVKEGDFKVEVKSNKVKHFDERADVAAARLVEFLLDWVKQTPDGTENLMYQLAMTLLERNKYGDLDLKSISKLYDMEIKFASDEYTSIMNLFRESNIVEGNAINFYFSRKDEMGVWRKLEPSFNRL